MRILVVSSYLPYPLHSGGHIRLYNLLKYLSKNHEVTLVSEVRPHQTEEDVAEVKKICREVYTVSRRKQWSVSNILTSLLSRDPFLVVGHTSELLKEKLAHLLSHDTFDIIHVETFYVLQNLPKNLSLPIVLVEHNIEYLVYQRYRAGAPFFLRPFLAVDIKKLKIREEAAWKSASEVIAVSASEQELIAQTGVKTAVVPNGVSLSDFPFAPKDISRKRLLFIGDFKWLQNRDSAMWILRDIWPALQRISDVTLWIVGKHIPKNIAEYASERVLIDENAPEDTAKIFQQAFLLLAPIRVGGGTSYKILEAMASGTPVITTPLGLQGIDAEDKKDILVAETPQDVVSGVKSLSEDPVLYQNMARNARKRIEENYSWPMIGRKLENVYREVADGRNS